MNLGDVAYFLVTFVETQPQVGSGATAGQGDDARVEELEHRLAATQAELGLAVEELETLKTEHRTASDQQMSVTEEFQSTNEELLTSKEELQSLNEELNALNNQLMETLEQQRTAANDLQNVLFSTNVATLFLDNNFNIRFFTPQTRRSSTSFPAISAGR